MHACPLRHRAEQPEHRSTDAPKRNRQDQSWPPKEAQNESCQQRAENRPVPRLDPLHLTPDSSLPRTSPSRPLAQALP